MWTDCGQAGGSPTASEVLWAALTAGRRACGRAVAKHRGERPDPPDAREAVFAKVTSLPVLHLGRHRAFIMGLVGPLALALILGGTLGGADDPAAFELGVAVENDGSVADGFRGALADLEDDRSWK